jgi:tetratricopeptide (TPR) repeat protein
VLRSHGRIRITADLVRAADDATVWSVQYDRAVEDVFAVQDDISRAIVNELRLKNVGGRRRYDTRLEPYELYLRADALANENSPGNYSRLQDAIDLFQRVVAEDAGFAPAFAGIADAYAHIRNRGRSRQTRQQMRDAAEAAIRLDPLLPEAYGVRGLVYAADLAWQDAEQAFRRALELNPNLARTHEDFALFVLLPEGKLEEALQHVRKAAELDPLSTSRSVQLAFVLLRAGDYGKALEIARRFVTTNDFARQIYARALVLAGKPDQAIPLLEKLGPGTHGYLGYAYARTGRRGEAERLAEESDPAAARHQVLIYAALGDRERCFEALHELAEMDDFMADVYPGEPELASLRNDPRMEGFRRLRHLGSN